MDPELLPAARILVAGGVANLVLSFLLGWVLAAKRTKEPIEKHHWLLVAHEVSLQEGVMLLGLAVAVGFAKMSPVWATRGAWLLVMASVFQDFSGVTNWLMRTGDQFAEKSLGWVFASINAVLNTAGLFIVAAGVAGALF